MFYTIHLISEFIQVLEQEIEAKKTTWRQFGVFPQWLLLQGDGGALGLPFSAVMNAVIVILLFVTRFFFR